MELGRGGHGCVTVAEGCPEQVVKSIPLYIDGCTDLNGCFMNEILALERLEACGVPFVARRTAYAVDHTFSELKISMERYRELSYRGDVQQGKKIVRQLFVAVAAMHVAGVVHLDLKPPNVMVDRHGDLKIIDFSLAKLDCPRGVRYEEIYTKSFRPPEVLLWHNAPNYEKCDTWAAGITAACYLLNERTLFPSNDSSVILRMMTDAIGTDEEDIAWMDSMPRMIRGDAPKTMGRLRSRLAEASDDVTADVIMKSLRINEGLRPTATELVYNHPIFKGMMQTCCGFGLAASPPCVLLHRPPSEDHPHTVEAAIAEYLLQSAGISATNSEHFKAALLLVNTKAGIGDSCHKIKVLEDAVDLFTTGSVLKQLSIKFKTCF